MMNDMCFTNRGNVRLFLFFVVVIFVCSAFRSNDTTPDERPQIVQKVLAFNGGKYMPVDDYVGRVVDSLMSAHPSDSLVILRDYSLSKFSTDEIYLIRTGKKIVCFDYDRLTHKISDIQDYRPGYFFNTDMHTRDRDILAEIISSFTLEGVAWKKSDGDNLRVLCVNYIWLYMGRIRRLNVSSDWEPLAFWCYYLCDYKQTEDIIQF